MPGLIAPTLEVAGHTLGIDARTLQRWISAGCPGTRGNYPIAPIIAWARENRWGEPDDVLMTEAATSPALERYREARATMVELDIAERRNKLVELDKLMSYLNRMMDNIRHAGEKVQREGFMRAFEIYDTALEECDRIMDEVDAAFPREPQPTTTQQGESNDQ